MAHIQNSFDFSPLRNVVLSEYNKWEKGELLDSQPEASPMLIKYWAYVGKNYVTPEQLTSIPWYAAYTSWVMSQVTSDFPKSSATRDYAKFGWKNRKNKSGGWTLYSLSREKGKIMAQAGDVLIKPRGVGVQSGEQTGNGKYLASLGDIVWSVKDGNAFLAGGNIGNTNKIYETVRVNSDGSYKENPKGYLVVLKKM
jgi:hypothetical protein